MTEEERTQEEFAEETATMPLLPSQESMDAVSFADSLASFGCSMREHFVNAFSSAWEIISPDKNKDMNFTASISHFLGNKLNFREGLSSIVDQFVPDFSPDPTLFNSDSSDDFFGSHRGGDKFIDLYSVKDATEMIKNTSIATSLENLGITDWYIEFDLSDCFMHYGYLRSKSFPEKEKFIGFLIVQKGDFRLKSLLASSEEMPGLIFVHSKFPQTCNMLNIRWFALQNPNANFSANKPRLPGQRYPGTGCARDCFTLFCKQAIKNGRDGIINVPEHFHNALLYKDFTFLDPDDQGEFEKMREDLAQDLKERGLAAVSWAIYLGFLRKDDEIAKWEPHDQIFPLSLKLFMYFQSFGFKKLVNERKKKCHKYHIVWEEAEKYCLSAVIEFSAEEVARIPKSE